MLPEEVKEDQEANRPSFEGEIDYMSGLRGLSRQREEERERIGPAMRVP